MDIDKEDYNSNDKNKKTKTHSFNVSGMIINN